MEQLTPVKQVLHQIQEMEKKRLALDTEVTEEAQPLMKDYIQYFKK